MAEVSVVTEPHQAYAGDESPPREATTAPAAHRRGAESFMLTATAWDTRSSASGLLPVPAMRLGTTRFAQGPGNGAIADVAVDSEESQVPGAPSSDDDSASSSFWSGWGLAPVRWGGALTAEMRRSKSEDQPRRLQSVGIANIRGSSYLWEPWFAAVSGGLGWLASRDDSGGGTGPTQGQPRYANATDVTGNGDVTLFPVSRFPFHAYFGKSDSRASGEQTLTNTINTRYGARQSYRPLEGNANFAASYDRSTLESAAFGRDTVDALAASMNRSAGAQAFEFTGSSTRNTRSNTGESAALSQFAARHGYRPERNFTVESLASASKNDFHLVTAGAPSDSSSRFAQANTFATWRPEEGSPLYLTGGGRVFRAAVANSTGETESLTLSGNLAATYALTQRTSITGSAMVTQFLSDATDRTSTMQSASVTHLGDPAALLGSVYTWNGGANVSNETVSSDSDRRSVGGQLGHNLAWTLPRDGGSQLGLGFGQGVGATYDTVSLDQETLTNTGNISWRLIRGAATSAYSSLSGSDTRTWGYNANHFQLINFQVSGQTQSDRNSSVAANLTLQGIRQKRQGEAEYVSSLNASGNVSYFHLRAFDVPRLRYSARYSVNESQYGTRLQGNVNAPREQVSQAFEQQLDYNVGRIVLRLSIRLAEIDGQRNTLAFFRLSREFGRF